MRVDGVAPPSVRRYRRDALRRPPSRTWRAFLALHARDIWAADFFTNPTLRLQTLSVCFVISHDRRRILHWNVTTHPTKIWVWHQIIAATPWGVRPRFLIRDRDGACGRDFAQKAARLGITTILTPVRAPQANAIAGRVIGTIRRECLGYVIVLNERLWGAKPPSGSAYQIAPPPQVPRRPGQVGLWCAWRMRLRLLRLCGRARIDAAARLALTWIVQENPRWSVQRTVEELRAPGVNVSRATVDRYRPPRSPSPRWRTFLRVHAPHIWVAGFSPCGR